MCRQMITACWFTLSLLAGCSEKPQASSSGAKNAGATIRETPGDVENKAQIVDKPERISSSSPANPNMSAKKSQPAAHSAATDRKSLSKIYIDDLVRAWNNEIAAEEKYKDKIVLVFGVRKNVNRDGDDAVLVLQSQAWGGQMGTPVVPLEIDCRFSAPQVKSLANVGHFTKLSGVCKGKINGRVLLVDCELASEPSK